ncbi:hypothetical protein [Nocardia asiatica]|uniref:hypothetical protein n=1 Tax=Nocardia asiatica TaxID=209252 RepID=UPI0012F76DDC|nr:hypothetical protein [Nocardia asiatica]
MGSVVDRDNHRNCVGGCMLTLSAAAIARRESTYKLDSFQLDELLTLAGGLCMICQQCHAMVIDTTTRAEQQRPRGLVCRFCKDRIATYEGSFGDEVPFLAGCRCMPRDDPEWEPRIAAATAQYLHRAAALDSCATNAERYDMLIGDLAVHGRDPHGVWSGTPLTELPPLPVRNRFVPDDYGGIPPLARDWCEGSCRAHAEHLYIACFDEPTMLRDADTRKAVLHYVGWTRQHPPLRRVNQHGPACREFLVAILPGTLAEEAHLKAEGLCPKCGQPLRYH